MSVKPSYPNLIRTKWGKKGSEYNPNSIYSIFSNRSFDKAHRITKCEYIEVVWNILEKTYWTTRLLKVPKLQVLTLKFEIIKMEEEQMFTKFYAQLNDTLNLSFNLGKN